MIKSFKNQIKYEIKVGILLNWKRYLFILGIFSLFACCLFFSMDRNIANHLNISDYLVRIFMGTSEWKFADRSNTFYLPKEWAVIEIMYFLFICIYSKQDYKLREEQVLLRSQNIVIWWIGKCIWLILTTLCYYFIFYGVFVLISIITGTGLNGAVNIQNVWGLEKISLNFNEAFLVLYILPWMTSLAIGFFQMLFSMIINPIAAISMSITYLIAAVYVSKPWLLGNYSMILRDYQVIGQRGVNGRDGLIYSFIIAISAIVAGCFYMKKKRSFI